MKLAEAFRRLHETDHFAALEEKAMTATKKRGPKPQFTSIVEIAFSPEQVQEMTRRAAAEKRSRNALVRAAVEAYLSQGEPA